MMPLSSTPSDSSCVQANGKHIFAAVFTQAKSTRGGLYLRQHLYSELLSQLTKQKGDVSVALQAAVDVLDADYRSLNPASHHILQGLEMAVAFLDFKSSLLYIWSNGSCRYYSALESLYMPIPSAYLSCPEILNHPFETWPIYIQADSFFKGVHGAGVWLGKL